VYWVGLLILWTTSLPAAIDAGASLGGFATAIVVIGFGTGGIKSNIAPLIADQYQRHKMAIKTQTSGERTIIDPAITYQASLMDIHVMERLLTVSVANLHDLLLVY
jgi:proton-dependent oligopeptide transporter, POT family